MVGEFLLLPKPAPHQSRSIILYSEYKYIHNYDSNTVYDTTNIKDISMLLHKHPVELLHANFPCGLCMRELLQVCYVCSNITLHYWSVIAVHGIHCYILYTELGHFH